MEEDDKAQVRMFIRKELDEFARIRGITEYGIRLRTVTSSIDATLRELRNVADTALMKKKIAEQACSVETIRHLVSVYINVLVHTLDSSSSRSFVFDETFLGNASVLLSGGTFCRENKENTRVLNQEQNVMLRRIFKPTLNST